MKVQIWIDQKLDWEPNPSLEGAHFADGASVLYFGTEEFKRLNTLVYRDPEGDSIRLSGEGGSWFQGSVKMLGRGKVVVTYKKIYSPVRIVGGARGDSGSLFIDTLGMDEAGSVLFLGNRKFIPADMLSGNDRNMVTRIDLTAFGKEH